MKYGWVIRKLQKEGWKAVKGSTGRWFIFFRGQGPIDVGHSDDCSFDDEPDAWIALILAKNPDAKCIGTKG